MIANDYPCESEDDKAIDELLWEFKIFRALDRQKPHWRAVYHSNLFFISSNQNRRNK